MRKSMPPETISRMQELYDSGMSMRMVGRILGCSPMTMNKYIIRQDRKEKPKDEIENPLPLRAEDVRLNDPTKDHARFRVTIMNTEGALIGTFFSKWYPNWRTMYEHCLVYGLNNFIDFADQENCLKDGCTQVRGKIIGEGGGVNGKYVVDFLTDTIELYELFK